MDFRKAIVGCLFILVGQLLVAQRSAAQSGNAGQAGEFLRFGVGAKPLGMGGAFTSIADDASAVYWNPAGIGQLNQPNIGLMHSELFLDTRYQFLGIASPLNFMSSASGVFNHSLGFGFINLQADNFDGRDELNAPTGSFGAKQWAVMLPYAFNIVNTWGDLSLGIKPQLFSQEIQNVSDTGAGLDIGVIYQPISPRFLGFLPLKSLMPLRLGINYRMLSSIKLLNESVDYPNSLNAGASYAVPLVSSSWKVIVAYEFEKIFNTQRNPEHHFGAEVRKRFGPTVIGSLRLGYDSGGEKIKDKLNVGAGFKTDQDFLSGKHLVKGFELDFSLLRHPVLDNAFQAYFTLKLGKPKNNIRDVPRDPTSLGNVQDAKLIDVLSEYPFDDRVIEQWVDVDSLYKFVVAEELHRRAKEAGNDFLAGRYCGFIGGLCDIGPPPVWYTIAGPVARTTVPCDGTFDCDRERIRRRMTEYLRDFEGKEEELSKRYNFDLLVWYLQAQLILGENERVVAIVTGADTDIKNPMFDEKVHDKDYFLAFATKKPEYCERVIQNYRPQDISRNMFLQLTKAVTRENANDVRDLLVSNRSELFQCNLGKYDPYPILCDGILADDIMFIDAYQQAQNLSDAKLIRDLFLPIVYQLPHSDFGRAITAKLSSLYENRDDVEATRGVFDELWRRYRALFLGNDVISAKYLLQPDSGT